MEFDPKYLPAKLQLCQDLLRLGKEAEGWNLASQVFEANPYSVLAHNLATLHDRLNQFTILIDHGFMVRMDSQEAKIYGPRVLGLLKEAKQVLCEKYEIGLPNRSMSRSIPGNKISPSAPSGCRAGPGFWASVSAGDHGEQPRFAGGHPSNWEAVLWHEFCHTVTLKPTTECPAGSARASRSTKKNRRIRWGQSMTRISQEDTGRQVDPGQRIEQCVYDAPQRPCTCNSRITSRP